MTKKEIQSKFDEIVDFSGCELYIDTPTKRYSSGMTVRLGFAVAAFLEPEILVVDEVLAVGDAEFQKKAIGKMKDISNGEGRTILFVSHNLDAVTNLCTRLLLFNNGTNVYDGDVQEGINKYLENVKDILKVNQLNDVNIVRKNISFDKISLFVDNEISTGQKLQIELQLTNIAKLNINQIRISIAFSEEDKIKFLMDNSMCNKAIRLDSRESKVFTFTTSYFPLGQGSYDFIVYIESEFGEEISWRENKIQCVTNTIFGTHTKIRPEWPKSMVYTPYVID